MSILTELQEAFPDCWFKPGVEFDWRCSALVWSGEGSYIGDLAAFDSYDMQEEAYTMGVHKELDEFVWKRGYYWEAMDAGTFMLYEA